MNKKALIPGLLTRLGEYGELVKFEHTVFALPFALSALLLALPTGQWPLPSTVLWVVLAMVGGRTYAMGLNRLIDAGIDARNPRTANRALPAGRVHKKEAWALVLLSASLLTASAFQLPMICQQGLPGVYLILTVYSWMKLFSSLAHWVLGLALGISAVGGWFAVTGSFDWLPIIFGSAVMVWVAGFDIIYACQDYEFDRHAGLRSMPVALGIQRALWVSRLSHLLTVALLVVFAVCYPHTGWPFWFAIALTAGMLLYEHALIQGDAQAPVRLEKINEAFFTVNGRISLCVFLLVLLDKLV